MDEQVEIVFEIAQIIQVPLYHRNIGIVDFSFEEFLQIADFLCKLEVQKLRLTLVPVTLEEQDFDHTLDTLVDQFEFVLELVEGEVVRVGVDLLRIRVLLEEDPVLHEHLHEQLEAVEDLEVVAQCGGHEAVLEVHLREQHVPDGHEHPALERVDDFHLVDVVLGHGHLDCPVQHVLHQVQEGQPQDHHLGRIGGVRVDHALQLEDHVEAAHVGLLLFQLFDRLGELVLEERHDLEPAPAHDAVGDTHDVEVLEGERVAHERDGLVEFDVEDEALEELVLGLLLQHE